MRLLLAWIFPPFAVLLCGKPFTALLNFLFTCFFWFPGVIHAREVVINHLADKRTDRLMKAVNHPKWVLQMMQMQPAPATRSRQHKQLDNPFRGSYTIGRNGTKFKRRNAR